MNLYLMDDEPERAEYVQELLVQRKVPTIRMNEFNPFENHGSHPILLVHWSILNRAFSVLSKLKWLNRFRMIFYCLCREKRDRGNVLLLPDELDDVIHRIQEYYAAAPVCK